MNNTVNLSEVSRIYAYDTVLILEIPIQPYYCSTRWSFSSQILWHIYIHSFKANVLAWKILNRAASLQFALDVSTTLSLVLVDIVQIFYGTSVIEKFRIGSYIADVCFYVFTMLMTWHKLRISAMLHYGRHFFHVLRLLQHSRNVFGHLPIPIEVFELCSSYFIY